VLPPFHVGNRTGSSCRNILYQNRTTKHSNLRTAISRQTHSFLKFWPWKGPFFLLVELTSKTVQRASLSLQGIYNIHSGNSLPLCMFGVCNSIPDYVLQKHFQHTARLLVNQTWYTLYTTSTCQPSDGRFRNSLDIIAQNLPMPLGTTFPQALSTLATTSHDDVHSWNAGSWITQKFLKRHFLYLIPVPSDQ